MHKGKIKRLVRDRGFGFINATDGREIFFHKNNLVEVKFEDLTDDQELEFDVERSDKGPNAVNVRIPK